MRVSNPFSYLSVLAIALTLAGCRSSGSGTSLVEAPPSTQNESDSGGDSEIPVIPAAPVPTSCTTTVVDQGLKGAVTNTARGIYSDIKSVPGYGPAVAYTDPSAVSVKFSYWNGTDFITEVVSGDGAGIYIQLAVLSTGRPFLFYSHGANLKAAMRTAPIGQTGTWEASVIDVGTVVTGLSVSVSPTDQIGVHFLTAATTAGRPRFLYCPAGCSSLTQFQTMNTGVYIENTNTVANVRRTGTAWCNAGSGTYYPAVVYTGNTNQIRYAVCRRSNLSDCLSAANWDIQSVISNSSVSTQLYLDSSVVGDVPKVVALKAGVGIKTYLMNGSTSCASAPTTFAENTNTIGGTNSGSVRLNVAKDSAGKFHIVANESTTSLRYYNSTSTGFTGTWNTAGVIETVTLGNPSNGGMLIDEDTSTIYASYGQAAGYFDLKLGRINDYTVASNSATFSYFYPDLSGNILLSAANSQWRNIAVAKQSNGTIGAAYVDYSVGAVTNAKMKYAIRQGSTSSSEWTNVQLPGTNNPQYPSLAYDPNNRPWITYFDTANNRFFLAKSSNSSGSGSWTEYELPYAPSGAPIALPAANDTSVVIQRGSGSSFYVVVVLIDNNATTRGVKAIRFNPSNLTWSSVATLDALSTSGAAHLSAGIDSNGHLFTTYYDITATRAKYNYSTDGLTWESSGVAYSGTARGMGLRTVLNPASQTPASTYYDRANNRLYLAYCTESVEDCYTAAWTEVLIENNTLGISGVTAAQEQVLSAELQFTPDGIAALAYSRGAASTGELMLAHNYSNGAAAATFTTTPIYSGINGTLTGAAAFNFGLAAWGQASVLNNANSLTILHLGPGAWLYSTSCGD